MRMQRAYPVVGLACLLLAAAGGCGPVGLFDPADDGGTVLVMGVERLSSPAVADPELYRPEFTFPIDASNPASLRAAGFFLDISASRPERLAMRVLGGSGGTPAMLRRISPPVGESLESGAGWDLPAEARDILLAGEGVFWLEGRPRNGQAPNQRVGVVLPDTWAEPSIILEVYTSIDGNVSGVAQIELAHDFFYMAAIGDSVVWGNGLREPDKFSRLVAAEVQRRTGRRVLLQVHAISGVRIVPAPADVICRVRCNGEVQTAGTSITTQVDLLEAPHLLEVVLMDGCINDVGVTRILDTEIGPEALAELTRAFCHDEMLKLLRKVRSVTPAKIIVTGYYSFVSEESSLTELTQYVLVNDTGDNPSLSGVAAEIAGQSRTFWETSVPSLAAAVQESNAESAEPARVAFVDPGFGPHNALFATEPLLWGLTADRIQQAAANEGLTLYPEDPLADVRATGCFKNRLVDPISCLYASVGHPNPAGARRYADAIIPILEQLGVLPPAGNP